MKKLMLIFIATCAISCSNPEDKATGNGDSANVNNSSETNLNTPPGPTDPASQTETISRDSSKAADTSMKH